MPRNLTNVVDDIAEDPIRAEFPTLDFPTERGFAEGHTGSFDTPSLA